MKAIFILLVLAGIGVGGFYGYKFLEDNNQLPWQKPGGETTGPDKNPRPSSSGVTEPSDKLGTDPTPKASNVDPKPDPIEELYPIPEFDSLEKITDNWTKIPAKAFPWHSLVKTKEPAKLEIAPGAASNLPAGTEMQAVAFEDGMLVLALDPNSTARAKLPPTATTFVDQVAAKYDADKKKFISTVMAQRDAARKREAEAKSTGGSSTVAGAPVVATRPARDPGTDPRLAPMVQSIKGGDSAEIEMKNVQTWRWGGKTKHSGQEYDYGLITYSVDTLFGTMDTEAMALIKNGKVQKWVYTGSGEEVP